MNKTKLAIFASGSGTNAKSIIDHFRNHDSCEVTFLMTNNPSAGVIQRVCDDTKVIILSNEAVADSTVLIDLCRTHEIDYVILAGYLRYIPVKFTQHFQQRILNVHPSLLPKFGGAGMYGIHVHEKVIASKESISGITIHFVNEEFDKGLPIAQFACPVQKKDDPSTLAKRIQILEHTYYPIVIEQTIQLTRHAIFKI